MTIFDLCELHEIKAIGAALQPSVEAYWRRKCRDYSVKFHTPLHTVMNELDPSIVLQALYEDLYDPRIVNEELEELLETLNIIKDPNYSKLDPQELEDLVDAVMNREIARAAKKKAPTLDSIKAAVIANEAKKQRIPKSGSMDFSSLEKLEEKDEFGKSGFED
jgi:hypothetical protein